MKKLFKKIIESTGYTLSKKLPVDDQADYGLDIYNDLYAKESIKNKLFYNVGSGDFYHPCWTNLDYVSDWYKAGQKYIVHIDLLKLEPLPIADNSAEVIYTSHTIEHVTDEADMNFFKESYRALKPGGFLRITCPDADTDYDAMKRNDNHWFYWDEWYSKPGTYEFMFHKPATSVPLVERWLHHIATQLTPNDKCPSDVKLSKTELDELIKKMPKEELFDHLTSFCKFQPERPGNHISWWNENKLKDFLTKAGFTVIYRSCYLKSKCPVLRNEKFFDNTHPQMAVYMEAIKS